MKTIKQHLEEYQKQHVTPMHMPGHKRNSTIAPHLNQLSEQLDITEIEGFDNLHCPQGILKESMEYAARVFHSDRSLFLVNGSTCGILAGIRALTKRGDKILVARNCHKSVYHAIELCGLYPVFVLPPVMESGICGSLSPKQVEDSLTLHPDIRLVVVTSPTYEGVISDVRSICELAHQKNIPVLVDEAHGAHLDFCDYFSGSAVGAGADITVQSLHKTLPSLTQTAILHIKGERVDQKRLEHQLSLFETSSPSYLLLSSIDGCIQNLKPALFEDWAAALKDFYQKTRCLKHIQILQKTSNQFLKDPSKIVLLTPNGEWLTDQLRKRKIEPEMTTPRFVLAMTGLGDTENTLNTLAEALIEIDSLYVHSTKKDPLMLTCPTAILPPEQALEEEFEIIPAAQAVGKISAEYIWAYPPGVPLYIPGEQLSTLPDIPLLGTRGNPPHSVAVLKSRKTP